MSTIQMMPPISVVPPNAVNSSGKTASNAAAASKLPPPQMPPVNKQAPGKMPPVSVNTDTVKINAAAQALQEATETRAQTMKEANAGDLVAKRLLAREAAEKANA